MNLATLSAFLPYPTSLLLHNFHVCSFLVSYMTHTPPSLVLDQVSTEFTLCFSLLQILIYLVATMAKPNPHVSLG
jgi:hypothetical protein